MQIGIGRGKEIVLHPHLAVGRLFKKIHTAKERTLSASRGADNYNAFAALDITRNAVEHAKLAEILKNILNAYHRLSTSFLSI